MRSPSDSSASNVVIGGSLRNDTALRKHTSLRVGGVPEQFLAPKSEAELEHMLIELHAMGTPVRVLGGGFNVLVGEGTIEGAVIATRHLQQLEIDDRTVLAGAGLSFPRLVSEAARLGLKHIAGCPGIPGSVGGVIAMNAGGRHGCVGDDVVAVHGYHLDGTRFEHVVERGDMQYRSTVFQGRVVTAARFRRSQTANPEALRALTREALAWKRATQPLGQASAGCIFKNPDGPGGSRSAGRLIDEAGMKGHRMGGAIVSPIHANFIVNEGDATADDVHALIEAIRARVLAVHGVELELEVHAWPARPHAHASDESATT